MLEVQNLIFPVQAALMRFYLILEPLPLNRTSPSTHTHTKPSVRVDLFSSVRSTFLSEPSASRPGLEACIRPFTPTSLPLEQKRKLLNDGPFRVETEPVLAIITLRTATLSFRSEAVAAVFVGVFSMLCCFVFNVVLFSINKTTRNCPKQSMTKQKEKNKHSENVCPRQRTAK